MLLSAPQPGHAADRESQIAVIWNFLTITSLQSEQLQDNLQREAVKINSVATYAFLPDALESNNFVTTM